MTNQYNSDTVSPPGDTLIDYCNEQRTESDRRAQAITWMRDHSDLPLTTITRLIYGEEEIDKPMAHMLEEFTDIPASFWLERERRYREAME